MQRQISSMPIHDHLLRHALLAWFCCGCLLLALFPALRESSPLLGWLPFWLIVAPLFDLALLDRKRLMAVTCALLVRARHRRRPVRQARRHVRHRRARLRPLLAALLSR
jgi:hypothetical protein